MKKLKIIVLVKIISFFTAFCISFAGSLVIPQRFHSPLKLPKNHEEVKINLIRSKRFTTSSNSEEQFHLKLTAFDRNYDVKFVKPRSSIYTKDFKFQTLQTGSKKERRSVKDVTPSDNELNSIEDNHLENEENGAVISVDNKTGDIHGVLDDLVISSAKDGNKTVQVVKKNTIASLSLEDAMRLNDSPDSGQRLKPGKGRRVGGDGKPETVNPEVLVIFDNKIYQRFNGVINAMTDYAGVMFRGINNRYAAMKDPKIRFSVSGIRAMSTWTEQAFMTRHPVPDGTGYDMGETHSDFSKWIYNHQDDLPRHDMTMFITAEDLQVKNDQNGDYNKMVNGRAWIKGACYLDQSRRMSMATGVAEDLGLYTGLFTIAHELAHNLAAAHDGEGDSSDCSWEDGHIMSYKGYGTRNKFFFSSCSIRSMKMYVESSGGDCLKTGGQQGRNAQSPESHGNIGRYTSMQDICRDQTKKGNAYVPHNLNPNDLCKNIVCSWQDGSMIYTQNLNIPAAEDILCGHGGRCWNGDCLSRLDRIFLRI